MTVLLLAMNLEISRAISFNCSYRWNRYDYYGWNVYECSVTKLHLDERNVDKITEVNGTRQIRERTTVIASLSIDSQNMQHFPVNIEKFFPDLALLIFPYNSLTNISNHHLAPFPYLECLDLHSNKITSVDSNLFYGLKSLIYIDLSYNNIMHVGQDFILPQVGTIDFQSNPCINKRTNGEYNAITHLRIMLLENCPPAISPLESTLENLLRKGITQKKVIRK